MKKKLLLIAGLLLLFNLCLNASNRYWVGGSGAWNDASHWSALSGGAGGAALPTAADDVFFDENSVNNAAFSITISGTAACNNILFSEDLGTANLGGNSSSRLEIYGAMGLSSYVRNAFRGEIAFKGTGVYTIDFKGATPQGNVRFSGSSHSEWNLGSDLILPFSSNIIIEGGNVNAAGKNVQAFGLQWLGTTVKSLNISNSKLLLAQAPDLSGTNNSTVINTNGHIYSRASGGTRAIDSIHTVVVEPLCNISCDGSITVTVFASSSPGPFSFSWTGGGCGAGCAGNPLINVCNGSYLLTVTDLSDGSTFQQFVTVIAPNPIGANFVKRKPKCFGQCNGSITANVVPGSGTPPYTYSWTSSVAGFGTQTTAAITGLCVGTYSLTVTDAHNCTQNFTQVLTQPAAVTANVTSTNISCFGVCDGTASSAPAGGNVPTPYTYAWSGPLGFSSTLQNPVGLCAGVYNVVVKDDSLCSGNGSVTITQPPVLVITPSSTNISCNGACDGTASVSPVSGGTPGYTYTWTPASAGSGPVASGLCPGAYSITVKDTRNCSQTANFNITQPAVFSVSVTGVNVSCFGGNNGSVTATVAGGTGPFTYAWSPGPTNGPIVSTSNTISSQIAGTYVVTVTDFHGCTANASFTITQPAVLVANPTATNVLCFGQCNGTATAAPTGGTPGYTYSWTGPPGFTTANTQNISSLCPGTYVVTVTDSKGCTSVQSVTITQPPVLTLTITKTNVLCNGACNGTATANPGGGTPGYTYAWTGPAGFTATTQTISSLCPGIYTVTITDANGCTKTLSTTITQPNVLNVTLSSTVLLCNAACNATITSTVTGGTPAYSFLWAPGGQTTPSITNQCAGVYTLTVTDANGCTKVVSITVTQPTPLAIVTSSSNITCFGICNGTASAIAGGGTPGYSYLWSPGGATTSSISGKCAGVYTVTVRDANGCTISASVTITEPPQLFGNPGVVNNVTCSGLCNGSAYSAATGGVPPYIYNWNGLAVPAGDGTDTITALCAGNYPLLVTDANSCTSNQSVTITQPSPLGAPISGSTSSCNVCNGTATVSPVGGTPPYSFLWNDGQTTATATGLCPNTNYSVIVTDANGCTASSSVTIAQTIVITITTSNTTLSCFGSCDGIATANPAGGQAPYTYLWADSSGPIPAAPPGNTVTNLCAGTYSVTVVDANGCLNTDSVTFTNPPAITLTATSTNASCGGTCDGTATGTPGGGTGAFTYSWNSSPVQTTQTATNLCAGTYTLTVTDVKGCTDSVTVVITQPTPVVDNPTVNNANCLVANGSITVAPTGGTGPYSYNWGPGAIVGQGTPTASALLPGAYTLTITDGAGCVYNFNYLINNINGPTLTMAHTNVSCTGLCNGTATVTASGGVPGYTYDWNGTPAGDGTPGITALCGTAVAYTVTVTDAAGCITNDTATIIDPLPISPNPTVVNQSCGAVCDGSITLNPTGGTGAYSYAWSPAGLPPNSSQSGLCAGAYSVTITDINGCTAVLNVNILSPPALSVTLASTNVLCNAACNGTATATITGGTGADVISWSNQPPSIILPNIVNLCPNQYIITVTDAAGCVAKDTVDITEPAPLITSASHTDATCNAVCNGLAWVTASGGTPGYSYTWSPGVIPANDTASSLCAGSYIVNVTDANGCVSSPAPIVISEPTAIVPNVTFVNPRCNITCNGTATSAASGGTAPYIYNWNPGNPAGDGTPSVTGLCAGNFALSVTDAMGCSNTQNFTLIAPPALTGNPTSTSPTCQNSCNGSVTATPAGGTPGYTYSWSPGGATTATVINLCPNIYQLIVTDNNNCKDTQTVAVINPAPINIAISSTPAACGVCDGTISINPLTGTPGYTYLWTPAPTAGQGTANATSVCAGLYDVTVTDSNGCDSTFTIPLNNSGGVTGETVSTVDVTCNAMCNGSGSVVPIGGTPPYTYLWNDGPPPTANDSAMNLCAGNYFVQVTDSNTCVHFSPVTINQPPPILSNGVVTNAICSNVCNGVINLFPSGGTPGPGYTFLWSPAPPAGQGTSTVTGLCPGIYTVTITDNNLCTKLDTFVVSQSTPLTVVASSTNISCSNANTGIAYLTISSGTPSFTIQWNDPSGQTNDTATALGAGVYTAFVTDGNGCTASVNTTITSTPAVALNASVTNATCGICDGSAVASPSGGTAPYSLLWSNGQSGLNASNLCSGLYTVNVTDNAGCVSSFGVPVSNTGGPTSLAITSTNITCNGASNGAVTAVTPSGGTAPYSYLWIAGGQTTPTLAGLSAGAYFIQVTDANGCSITDSVLITEPAPIMTNQVVTAAGCGLSNGSIALIPSGGSSPYTYLWNTGSTNDSLMNLNAGIYSVQITDAASCMINVVIPVNNQGGPSLVMSATDVTCNALCNGSSTVAASGGLAPYSYLWNDVGAQTTPSATSLCAGNYAVLVRGADGCASVGMTTITEPSAIAFSIANAINPLCNGDTTGSITVVPSGGTLSYTYSWSPSGGTGLTASNLGANTYIVTVTDANGCTAMQSTTLVQTTALTITSAVTNPSCSNLSDGAIDVTVSGGTSTYTYVWSNAAVTQDVSAIGAGTYTVNVTDGNGCMIADTSTLVPNQSVLVFAGNDTTFCQNGSLTLTAVSAAGLTYQWFQVPLIPGVGNTASVNVTPPTGTTTYYVIADNGSGCTASDSITVTSNALPVANAGSDVTIVVGESTPIGGSPTGSSGTSILWNPLPGLDNATLPNPTATPASTTTYTVSVTTPQGCSASDSMTVTVLPTIVIPDGISPNADGDNDEWVIDGIELFPNCVVEVYNRWGELLFQSVGYKEHWKGTYKGKELPVGSYYYVIDLKDPLFPDVYTGPITILR